MKSIISKFFIGGALLMATGLTSCVGDLNQLPADERTMTAGDFKKNPKEYIGGAMGKCYSGIAVSGQGGAGASDISGLDHGRSCWSRAIFMMNEFPTDEVAWIWKDSGVFDLVTATWSSNNENVFGTYSRLLTHIAICNDFLRLTTPESLASFDIPVGQDGTDGEGTAISQADIDQFRLEARALRDLSYFYVIDIFGNAVNCWDDQQVGEEPPYMKRADLYAKVVADLEDILTVFPEGVPVYGRISKDSIRALLCKFYLNAEVFTGTPEFQKCWDMCQTIINNHKGGGFQGSGLAMTYQALFGKNNDMFAPGGSLPAQNEILWNIPYEFERTESYGGSSFLILAAISDKTESGPSWYGINGQWTCMHAREQFSQKFHFNGAGLSDDNRTFLWLTNREGCTITNNEFTNYKDGYVPIKFTNVPAQADGVMPLWWDPKTNLPRAGVHDLDNPLNYGIQAGETFADTDLPVIRLAEIYLTAAEAYVRGNVGNQNDAKAYVNYVRERAGVPAWTITEITLDNLLDERARELYWENCRRTDLVRFGKFTSGYTWNWKNNIPLGADISSHMNLFPIPTQVINSYSSPYPQNPGY